ncbi:D-aminoacyl-tRNA deacylase [Nitratiruptor sp. SB155-2]|uniref:D-aminoacyl-tRNA deacylase n=1 Tax=Nitratiruptor sp. (strain SB155-2) TaxID=387092 RepID=DTD_NITSB|nr:D-aminoacyl-tRNA deacylase [Nitratiruptor sp. SB155-2]A6Q128.1 RecName: Full=D-aminoacyl-tRNA deacylase; Short=DTD; AltName: Full=Gly-tRNA(Ala) deacylase [Nitratiruptor sp. SB155-2]BAF69187.1 D-tyrosyl-tRNA deacylase [Nitratiruptor sp. SB155-2]
MVALIQRVKESWVKIDGTEIAKIGKGYNILLGVMKEDTTKDIEKLIKKIVKLRLFPNESGKMDKNILEVKGSVLVVSQFTLAGNAKKGNRPDFTAAMPPKEAKELYDHFCQKLSLHLPVQTGLFGAMMEVGIINDGPVTLILDSKKL